MSYSDSDPDGYDAAREDRRLPGQSPHIDDRTFEHERWQQYLRETGIEPAAGGKAQ
jgi:hypothetical protein